jgi:hypothetical protein
MYLGLVSLRLKLTNIFFEVMRLTLPLFLETGSSGTTCFPEGCADHIFIMVYE